MKKTVFFLLLTVLACGVQSCKKDMATDYVLLRVENKTSTDFRNVFTSDAAFGIISSNSRSEYKRFDKILDIPSASMEVGDKIVLCGPLYLDYRGYIESGKYTLQIFEDTPALTGYNCKYIKE